MKQRETETTIQTDKVACHSRTTIHSPWILIAMVQLNTGNHDGDGHLKHASLLHIVSVIGLHRGKVHSASLKPAGIYAHLE